MMRKIPMVITIIAMSTLIAGCAKTGSATSFQDTGTQRTIAIVSGHPDRKPVMYKEGDAIAGIGVDVTREAFKSLGFDIESRYVGTWDIVQQKARDGEIDAIVALYKTVERQHYLNFSIAYTEDPVVLFFAVGKAFPYETKQSLDGKKGIAMVGDSYGQEIDDYIIRQGLDVTRVTTPQEAFAMLKEGKGDYFIYSRYSGRRVIDEGKLVGFTESSVVSTQPFYIGISKKSPFAKHMKQINAELKKMIEEDRIPQN